MLYAFEQLIINTEEEGDEYYGEEGPEYGEEGDYYDELEMDPNQIMYYQNLGNQQPRIPIEQEYLSNPSDIIDEEEFEESEAEESIHSARNNSR